LFTAFVRDISERKRAQKHADELRERFTIATTAAGVGVWDWNVPENILLWDEQMYRLYGIAPDQFSGTFEAWEARLPPDDSEPAAVMRALRGEEDFDTMFRVVWPDQSVHYIKGRGVVKRDAHGQPVRMLGLNWDITVQQEQAAELLIRTEELSRAQASAHAAN